jgi:Holliday junction resolvase RusA-like endonuclease
MINFVIPGQPFGKERPRMGRGYVYTPKKTVEWEKNAAKIVKEIMDPQLDYFESEALQIKIMAYYKIPKAVNRTARLAMLAHILRPTVKPDNDNILKIVQDSLNGVCYKDDAQIVKATVEKWYSDEPRVEVFLKVVVSE